MKYGRKSISHFVYSLVHTDQCERPPPLRRRHSWSDFAFRVFGNHVCFGFLMRAHLSAALFTDDPFKRLLQFMMTSSFIWCVFASTLRCSAWARCRGSSADCGSQRVCGWPSICRELGYNSHFLLISSYGHRMFRDAEPNVWRDCPVLVICYHRTIIIATKVPSILFLSFLHTVSPYKWRLLFYFPLKITE